jgi:hypothetical protein
MRKITPKRLIIDVDKPLHAKIKNMALQRGHTIKELITNLIIKEIIKREYKKDMDSDI